MGADRSWEADKVTLFICKTCLKAEGRPGLAMIDALRAAFGDAEVAERAIRPVSCLANCEQATSAALTHCSGWSYVFGGLTADNIPDLIIGAQMLAADERGFLPLKGRPQCLRGSGLAARIPPFSHLEDLI